MQRGHPHLCSRKEFGYSSIKWSIKNYFAPTQSRNWELDSPDFIVHGDQCTKWQLSLKSHSLCGVRRISVFLKSLQPESVKIRAKWKMFSPFESQEVHCEVDYEFGDMKVYGMLLCCAGKLEDAMLLDISDTFTIKCQLIVFGKERKMYDGPKDPGLKSLSQDMRILNSVANNHDITMYAGGEEVKAHKAVLCSRNEFLTKWIEESDSEVEFPDLTPKAIEHVLGYLYSANLDYVLRTPSFSICKCIKQFEIKELEVYYKRDRLVLTSEYRVKKHVLEWSISDIDLTTQNCITSDVIQEKELDMSFRLYLYSQGFSEQDTDYVSIFIEIVDGRFLRAPYFEFAVVDSNDSILYVQRKRWLYEPEKFGLQKFLRKETFKDMTKNGGFRILCNIMFYSNSFLATRDTKIREGTAVKTEHHYELLSRQISYLFESGLYSDLTIGCEGGSFKVHSCIVGARSYILKDMFQKPKEVKEQDSFYMLNIKYDVLMKMLSYIYSGRLLTQDFEENLKLYKAAESYGLLPLKYSCSSVLQRNLDRSNISRLLALADASKDYKLKACATSFAKAFANSSENFRNTSINNYEMNGLDEID